MKMISRPHWVFLGLLIGASTIAPGFVLPQTAAGSSFGLPQEVNAGPGGGARLSTQNINQYLNRLQELRHQHGYEACTLSFNSSGSIRLDLADLPSAEVVLGRIRQPSPDAILEFQADSLSLDLLRHVVQSGGRSRQYHLTCIEAP